MGRFAASCTQCPRKRRNLQCGRPRLRAAERPGPWRLENAGLRFLLRPAVRYPGRPEEQVTMFFLDPSGNALELKAFRDPAAVYSR